MPDFLIAIFLVFSEFRTLDYTQVFSQASQLSTEMATAIALCLLVGAIGKSAQIPLYTWLPDAMEGPTPVSALIHAATMVTAGVYMVVRNHVIFDMAPIRVDRLLGSSVESPHCSRPRLGSCKTTSNGS